MSKLVPSKLRKGSSKHNSINWGFSQNIQSIIPGTVQYIALYFLYQTKTIWDFWPLTDDWNWQFSVIWLRTTTNRTFTEDFSYIQKIIASHNTQKQALQSVVVNYTCLCVQLLFYFWPVSNSCKGELRKHGWGDSPVGRLTFLPTSRQSVWNVGGGVTTWGRISIWGVA